MRLQSSITVHRKVLNDWENKQKYTFIKNTIPVVAEDLCRAGYNDTSTGNDTRHGGFVMSSEATDLNSLLSRSQRLADEQRKEALGNVDR